MLLLLTLGNISKEKKGHMFFHFKAKRAHFFSFSRQKGHFFFSLLSQKRHFFFIFEAKRAHFFHATLMLMHETPKVGLEQVDDY